MVCSNRDEDVKLLFYSDESFFVHLTLALIPSPKETILQTPLPVFSPSIQNSYHCRSRTTPCSV